MLVKCEIEVNYRLLQVQTAKGSAKSCRGAVALCKKNSELASQSKEKDYCIVIYTTKYKSGFKYRVKGNIIQLFSRFMDSGRITLSFKEPQHDVSIRQANTSELKKLLHLIKLVCKGENVEEKEFSNPNLLQDVLENTKKEMKIKSRKDYPLSKPFPTSLCKLLVNSCGLMKFDNRISKLSHLTLLDLCDNKLCNLPDSLDRLPNLKELYLVKNNFTVVPPVIFNSSMRLTLRLLDMSKNKLNKLPTQICSMEKLTNLKVDNNNISCLPYNIGILTSLKYFSVAKNELRILPHSFSKLNIDSLDLSGNPLDTNAAYCITVNHLKDVPSLFEIAARQISSNRLLSTNELLPTTIRHYLESARTCMCGKHCFESYAAYITMVDLGRISHTITADIIDAGRLIAPAEGYLCSKKCYSRWQKKPKAAWH